MSEVRVAESVGSGATTEDTKSAKDGETSHHYSLFVFFVYFVVICSWG